MVRFWKRNQRLLAPFLFLMPGIFMFLVYVIIPIFQSINISFYEWDGLGEAKYIGLDNYFELIDDSYNANPSSMMRAIDVLAEYKGNKILVIGDMAELGNLAVKHHKDLAKYILEE